MGARLFRSQSSAVAERVAALVIDAAHPAGVSLYRPVVEQLRHSALDRARLLKRGGRVDEAWESLAQHLVREVELVDTDSERVDLLRGAAELHLEKRRDAEAAVPNSTRRGAGFMRRGWIRARGR